MNLISRVLGGEVVTVPLASSPLHWWTVAGSSRQRSLASQSCYHHTHRVSSGLSAVQMAVMAAEALAGGGQRQVVLQWQS